MLNLADVFIKSDIKPQIHAFTKYGWEIFDLQSKAKIHWYDKVFIGNFKLVNVLHSILISWLYMFKHDSLIQYIHSYLCLITYLTLIFLVIDCNYWTRCGTGIEIVRSLNRGDGNHRWNHPQTRRRSATTDYRLSRKWSVE